MKNITKQHFFLFLCFLCLILGFNVATADTLHVTLNSTATPTFNENSITFVVEKQGVPEEFTISKTSSGHYEGDIDVSWNTQKGERLFLVHGTSIWPKLRQNLLLLTATHTGNGTIAFTLEPQNAGVGALTLFNNATSHQGIFNLVPLMDKTLTPSNTVPYASLIYNHLFGYEDQPKQANKMVPILPTGEGQPLAWFIKVPYGNEVNIYAKPIKVDRYGQRMFMEVNPRRPIFNTGDKLELKPVEDDIYPPLPPIMHTITYKAVNGTFPNGKGTSYTEQVEEGTTPTLPTNMQADEGFENGTWDKSPTEATADSTYIYTFNPLPSYTVTYKVVNGTWHNNQTANITEVVTKGGHPAQVPQGMKANEGFEGGAWNLNPNGATITEDTEFTYTFTAVIATPTPTPQPTATAEPTLEPTLSVSPSPSITPTFAPIKAPKTGDNDNVFAILCMLMLSLGIIILTQQKANKSQ